MDLHSILIAMLVLVILTRGLQPSREALHNVVAVLTASLAALALRWWRGIEPHDLALALLYASTLFA